MMTTDVISQEGLLLLDALANGLMEFAQMTGKEAQFALAHTRFWQKVCPGWHPDMVMSIYGARPRAWDALPVGTILYAPTWDQLKAIQAAYQWQLEASKGAESQNKEVVVRKGDGRGSGTILQFRRPTHE